MSDTNKELCVKDVFMDSKKKRWVITQIEFKDENGETQKQDIIKDYKKMLMKGELQFACESIREILDFAQKTISMQKPQELGGGIYGVSLVLLLSCVFDAMGRIGLDQNDKVSDNKNIERFGFIQNHFKPILEKYGFKDVDFAESFYKIYRCGLVHSGTLTPNNVLKNANTTTVFVNEKGNTKINVTPLLSMTKEIFDELCKEYNICNKNEAKFLNVTQTGGTRNDHDVELNVENKKSLQSRTYIIHLNPYNKTEDKNQ